MKTKALTIILLVFLVVSMFAGCGSTTGSNETTSTGAGTVAQSTASVEETLAPALDYGDTGGVQLPIAKERIVVTALLNMQMDTPLVDTMFIRELEKRTNIQMVFQNINPGDRDTTINLLVASKNLPDIIGHLDNTSIPKFGEVNFVPLNKNLDIMPNFKKIMDEKPEIMKDLSNPDGNLYVFPYLSYKINPTLNYGMIYRKDIFDKLGLSTPKSSEEYYDALKKLKQAYPKSAPFLNYYGAEGFFSKMLQSWNCSTGFFQPEGKSEYVYGPATNECKEFLAFFAKLYQEGLLDTEILTSSYEQFMAKALQPENGFVFFGWYGMADSMVAQIKDKMPEYDLQPAFPIGPTGKNFKESEIADYGAAISSSSKHINEILQLYDYFHSPSGAELVTMGSKGVTYNVDADGIISYVGFEGKEVAQPELTRTFGLSIANILVVADPRSVTKKVSQRSQAAIDMLTGVAETSKPQPTIKLNEEEANTWNKISVDLNKIFVEYASKVITGKDSIDNWDSYLKKLEKAGLKTVSDIQSAAFIRYNK